MSDAASVDKLVDRIEALDASVVAEISALTNRCLVDSRNRTLFDAAIHAGNQDVIALLASDPDALEFAAPVDPQTKDPIRHSAAMHEVEVPVSRLEGLLEKSFGKDLAYGRTPLHSACRAGNTGAVEALLAAGASTKVKDAIGLTAPELAFYAHSDKGLGDFVAAFERSGQKQLPVGKRLLREAFTCPDVMEQLIRVARLGAYARRLLFCYRCAWLDIDEVQKMLADGFDPNKGLTAEINPLWDACTSALLWDEEIPGGLEMAYHYTKSEGHPGASAVSFDNALLNDDGSNFGKLFSAAKRKQKAQIKMVRKMTIEPDTERDVIAKRIALLDVLFDTGIDLPLSRKKLEFNTYGDLKQMNLGEVADHLKLRSGGTAKPAKKRKPAATTFWELVGETGLNTEYWPDGDAGGLLRLVLHNVYGPVDGITLSVRLSKDKSMPDGNWLDLKPKVETVDMDGETVPRASLTEPLYGEAPWEAIYDLPLSQSGGDKVLWIRLDHDGDEFSGELDPWQFVKD